MALPKGCLPSHEIPERIKRWLEAEEFSYVQIIGELARNMLFSYVVTMPSGTKITVFQPSNKKDSICISTALVLSADQVKKLRQKSKIEREEIFSELHFKLASVDVEFTVEGGEIYRRTVINHPIYYDALTKDRFFKAIFTVYKAFQLLSLGDAATVFLFPFFSVSTPEGVPSEEKEHTLVFWRLRKCWLNKLVSDQLATLQEMIEEKRAEVKNQLEVGDIETPEVNGNMGFSGRGARGFGLFKP